MARTGRRPGNSGTRDAILEAARAHFAAKGYERATIREVARSAGVDPALVHHYFSTKQQLFIAAMRLPFEPASVLERALADGVEHLGERLARLFLAIWDQTADRSPLIALLRSAVSGEQAAAMLREFIAQELLGPIAAQLNRPDAGLRVTLVASQIVGLAIARYVIRLEPLASAHPDTLAAAVAPTLQRYLTGDLGAGASP